MTVSILIVDDEPDVADLFRQRFRREAREGRYVLHFAFSAGEALERLARDIEPELVVILSDINMPGMDGLALLREVGAAARPAGDDGDRLWQRGAAPPRRRDRRRRFPDEADRFRSPEGTAAPAARAIDLRVSH